jgi:FtsP/CotA-like multicopper oxidase with cupredoxin domain
MNAKERSIWNAVRNRRELVTAQLSRRELVKLGLLTSAGYLVSRNGLSADDSGGSPKSPPTTPFSEPMPIPPVKTPLTVPLNPAPQIQPLPGEGRTRPHQALDQLPPTVYYEVHQKAGLHSFHPQLPTQTIWGFDGIFPGPTYMSRYGEPALVRNFNDLPDDNEGFGLASVSTHLHNGHTPSESDGFPCDFFEQEQFYDQHYPNVLAGFAKQYPPNGDLREAMSTLWYHDHRVDFTSQNVYKGLAGFYLLFNEFDTGDETTGFQLPSGPFDVPMMFTDKVFDRDGLAFFDLFNFDGILGDKFIVNGKIQPFLQVHPRKYRLRWLNIGPSRFVQMFLTNPANPTQPISFLHISDDGNLLPAPLEVKSVLLPVAERVDVIVDFAPFAGRSIILENRLQQTDGRGPTNKILPAGRGDAWLRFDVVLPPVDDSPPVPAHFYDLPPVDPKSPEVAAFRRFVFDRESGQWNVNGRLFDCERPMFTPREGTAEIWELANKSGGWQHPIHPHQEESRVILRNGRPPSGVEVSREDILRLGFNDTVRIFRRFRDFVGRYPLHCHNVLHEDHAMMARWDIVA